MFWHATVNTLKAGRLTLILARIFGKRIEGDDGIAKVVMYRFRGNDYLFDFTEHQPEATPND